MKEKKTMAFVFLGFLILLGFILTFSCTYTVDQSEYAVLETFGKPSSNIINPGLNFKLPYPIQSVRKISRETFSLTLGYEETKSNMVIHENESKMITGDENIILADLEVQWRISDPIAFLYNTDQPVNILYNATSSALRGVIGSTTVDNVLTDGRAEIMNDIRSHLTTLVNDYGLGVSIVNVNLQDVDLPNEEVSNAFKKVTSAREERITKINEANKYKNEKINTAEGQKEALISKAEGERVARIEQARGDVAKFNALYSEYVNSKDITTQRLIMETLEKVLPKAKIYIMDEDSNSNTIKYLPLENIKGGAK